MEKHPVTITEVQFRKLHKGKTAQLLPHQIAHSEDHRHHLMLAKKNSTKLKKARAHKKGVRISLEPHEIEETMKAGGFLDFLNKVKSGLQTAGSWLKHNIIDTPVYQQNIRPLARDFVNSTVKPLVDSRAGPLSGLANTGIDKLGEVTGAFGIKHGRRHKKHHATAVHEQSPTQQYDEYVAESMMMPRPGATGPGLFTAYPQPQTGSGVVHHYIHHMHGGSFRMA